MMLAAMTENRNCMTKRENKLNATTNLSQEVAA